MKYRAKSAAVLNEADRFERILDWQLFCIGQDRLLWGAPEGEWQPGEAIYLDPRKRNGFAGMMERIRDLREGTSILDPEWDEWEGPEGNCVRPMIQEFDEDHYYVAGWETYECRDCEVGWSSPVPNCWMCGEPRWRPKEMSFEHSSTWDWDNGIRPPSIGRVVSSELSEDGMHVTMRMDLDLTEWQENMIRSFLGMSVAADRAADGIRGMHAQLFSYMEADLAFTERLWTSREDFWMRNARFMDPAAHFEVESYHPPTRPDTGSATFYTNPFIQPDIRGPLWGGAEFYDPLQPPAESPFIRYGSQQDAFAELCEQAFLDYMNGRFDEDPPAPVMREIPLPEPDEVYWARYTNHISRRDNVRG